MTITDPAALLTRLEQAKQSRDVWQIGLAEQALEHAAPELAAEVVRLRAETARLQEVASRLLKARIARGSFYGLMQSKAYDQMIDELDAAKAQVRAALKGGEI
jgi:hypothetical protein